MKMSNVVSKMPTAYEWLQKFNIFAVFFFVTILRSFERYTQQSPRYDTNIKRITNLVFIVYVSSSYMAKIIVHT